jgi:hypothetical protein
MQVRRTLRGSRESDGTLVEKRQDERVRAGGLGIRGEISAGDVFEIRYLVHLLRCDSLPVSRTDVP